MSAQRRLGRLKVLSEKLEIPQGIARVLNGSNGISTPKALMDAHPASWDKDVIISGVSVLNL